MGRPRRAYLVDEKLRQRRALNIDAEASGFVQVVDDWSPTDGAEDVMSTTEGDPCVNYRFRETGPTHLLIVCWFYTP